MLVIFKLANLEKKDDLKKDMKWGAKKKKGKI